MKRSISVSLMRGRTISLSLFRHSVRRNVPRSSGWSRSKIRSSKTRVACVPPSCRAFAVGSPQPESRHPRRGIVRNWACFRGFKGRRTPAEREALALIATGGSLEEGRAQAAREVDFYELKGALEAAIEAANFQPPVFQKAEIKHLREGQAAQHCSEQWHGRLAA